ncbi:MAG TPA: T9SS type A sorting domain-containing protein [Bacteroidales bacterium]|nr:T9SS type A sorting domain-containing protein [Bacteroidales bacterium]HRZ77051.1 T9SS type A sorting domain-containing protein [Bacteroidales bacterium]
MHSVRSILCFSALSGAILAGWAQPLTVHDRDQNDLLVNDSVVNIFESDPNTLILTASFALKNNTPDPMPVLMKRTIHEIPDSTIDFYCFSIQCWFGVDSVTVADTIPPYGTSFLFSTHVCHKRYLELAPLPPGYSSITYTLFVPGTGIETSVQVNYTHSPLSVNEDEQPSFLLYPNPARDQLTLELPGIPSGPVDLVFSDLQGRVLESRAGLLTDGRITASTGHLEPGPYLLRVSRGNELNTTFRTLIAP